jgi:hypothetical protein
MSSQIKSDDRYLKHVLPRYCQGDILRDLDVMEGAAVTSAEANAVSLVTRSLPYAVVLSQECDLHQDLQNRSSDKQTSQDKYLHSVLLGPAYQAESFKTGEHLKLLGVQCQIWNSDRWKALKQNNIERYHFLPAADPFQVPDMVLDFKHFLTAPRGILVNLKQTAYIASLNQLFRENLSQRFTNFLSRIALPDPNDEAPEKIAEPA